MLRTRIGIHRFSYRMLPSIPPPFAINRFQLQRQRRFSLLSFLSHTPHPPNPFFPFHFHSCCCYSSISSSSAPQQQQDSVVVDADDDDDDDPTGDFNFKPLTRWKKFTLKLRLLTAFPWERVQYGTVLKINLRGQVCFTDATIAID